MVSSRHILESLQKRQAVHKQCFDQIVDICYKKIEKAALISRLPMCIFEVPDFMFGHPVYSINDAVEHVVTKLTRGGFTVQYFFPRILVISWTRPGEEPRQGQDGQQPTQMQPAPRQLPPPPSNASKTMRIRPLTELRPSGRFVLNL